MRVQWKRPTIAMACAGVVAGLLTPLAHVVGAQSSAPAANASPVLPGARVRVSASVLGPTPAVATVLAVHGDSLAMRRLDTGDAVRMARGDISSLEISAGQHTRVLQGTGIGFLAGTVVGAVVGAATVDKSCMPSSAPGLIGGCPTRGGDAVLGGIGGGVLGALVGGATGLFWKAEGWDRVQIAGRSARLRPGPEHGVAITLAVAF